MKKIKGVIYKNKGELFTLKKGVNYLKSKPCVGCYFYKICGKSGDTKGFNCLNIIKEKGLIWEKGSDYKNIFNTLKGDVNV